MHSTDTSYQLVGSPHILSTHTARPPAAAILLQLTQPLPAQQNCARSSLLLLLLPVVLLLLLLKAPRSCYDGIPSGWLCSKSVGPSGTAVRSCWRTASANGALNPTVGAAAAPHPCAHLLPLHGLRVNRHELPLLLLLLLHRATPGPA